MEEAIARLPEDKPQFLIVVGHQGGFGGLLRQLNQAVNVLYRFECFLKKSVVKHYNINF